MATTFKGPNPLVYGDQLFGEILTILNTEALKITREVTQATPVGIGGLLRQSWVVSPANPRNPVATVGNSRVYLLPLEMGRRPGAGISRKGRESLALWARRKLGVDEREARGIAYLVSEKYKREGRPAAGFLGLAKPGTLPTGGEQEEIEPVPGGLLDKAFKRLDKRLEGIPI